MAEKRGVYIAIGNDDGSYTYELRCAETSVMVQHTLNDKEQALLSDAARGVLVRQLIRELRSAGCQCVFRNDDGTVLGS